MLSNISATISLVLAITSGSVHAKTSNFTRNLYFSGSCSLNCLILSVLFWIGEKAYLYLEDSCLVAAGAAVVGRREDRDH